RIPAGGGMSFRFRNQAYWVDLSSTKIELTKNSNNTAKVLGSQSVTSAAVVGQWVTLGVDAVGPHITVSIGGKLQIDVGDQDSPILSGSAKWFGNGNGADLAAVSARKPTLVAAT